MRLRGGPLALAAAACALPAAAVRALPAAAQSPKVRCLFCQSEGTKPCKRHTKSEVALETGGVAEFCSQAISCKQCAGALRLHCEHCSNVDVERVLDAEVARNRAWLEKWREKVDARIEHEVLHASSKHFDLACDLKPMMVGRVRYSTHRLLHLYLERLEKLRDVFSETLELGAGNYPDRAQVFLWRDARDQAFASMKFAAMGSRGVGVKLMGSSSVYTMLFDKSRIRGDVGLYRNVVHNVAHLLLASVPPQKWIGQLKSGWLDAGVGHYFEYLLDGKCTNYCYQEVATNVGFKGGKWLVPVRRMVAGGRIPSFAEVGRKNTDQLEAKEHALSFSYVHFLLQGDYQDDRETGKKMSRARMFVRLVRELKQKKSLRDALRASHGWNPLSFDEKWRDWVLRTYPRR